MGKIFAKDTSDKKDYYIKYMMNTYKSIRKQATCKKKIGSKTLTGTSTKIYRWQVSI